jgi:hypothetical protein
VQPFDSSQHFMEPEGSLPSLQELVGTSHKAPGVRSMTGYLATEQSKATVDWLPSNQPVTQQWTVNLATVT